MKKIKTNINIFNRYFSTKIKTNTIIINRYFSRKFKKIFYFIIYLKFIESKKFEISIFNRYLILLIVILLGIIYFLNYTLNYIFYIFFEYLLRLMDNGGLLKMETYDVQFDDLDHLLRMSLT